MTTQGYDSLGIGDLILSNYSTTNISFKENVGWGNTTYTAGFIVNGIFSVPFFNMGSLASGNVIVDNGFNLIEYQGLDTIASLGWTLADIKTNLEFDDIQDNGPDESTVTMGYQSGLDHSVTSSLSDLITLYENNGMWIVIGTQELEV